jgi:putative NADH-flavin reductase
VVFGGTGGTGSECVVQALRRGAKVTVLARDPSKMRQPPGTGGANEGAPVSDPNLTVVRGNVSNPADVAKVITKDTTGVVVSLGGKTKDVGATMLTDGTTNVINAMKAAGIATDARIAIVTSIGAGDSANQAPIVFRVLMATVMRSIFNDKNNQEALFLGPGGPGRDLEFCVVRPGGLGVGPPTVSLLYIYLFLIFVWAISMTCVFLTGRCQRDRRGSREHRSSGRRGFLPRRPVRGGVPVHRQGAVHLVRGRDVVDQGPRRQGDDGGLIDSQLRVS